MNKLPRGSIGQLVKNRVVEKAHDNTARHRVVQQARDNTARHRQQQQQQRLQPASSSSTTTTTGEPPELQQPLRPLSELEVPPADIGKVIDMAAKFVAKRGAHFVQHMRHEAEQTGNVQKFAFLEPMHVYHRYYHQQLLQYRMAYELQQWQCSSRSPAVAPMQNCQKIRARIAHFEQ